jgi:hypothetical protein
MSTDFELTPHAEYLQVELAPGYEIKPDGTTKLLMAISEVCTRQGQRRVLIEGTVARRVMGMMDTYSFGSLVGNMLTGTSLACCLYGYARDQQTEFFRDVAENRGVRVEFFDTREAALRWLGVDSGS